MHRFGECEIGLHIDEQLLQNEGTYAGKAATERGSETTTTTEQPTNIISTYNQLDYAINDK